MKLKLALALAAAMFAGSFTVSTAQASYDEFQACMRECRQIYRACLAATPDKAELCYQFHVQCQADCGAYL